MATEIELPFPPSVNHYWRRVGARTLISRAGRSFRIEVEQLADQAKVQKQTGPLGIRIDAHPPDNRRRDLDNLLKAPLDAMQHGGMYEDDSQLNEIHLYRRGCVPGGKLIVSLWAQEGLELASTDDLRADLMQKAIELEHELAAIREALAAL
jgi:crossover junction endodeoxyribonuclease RusA